MSSAVKTRAAVSQLAGNVTEKMTVVTLRMNPKRSAMRGRVSRISSAVKTIAVFPAAGSVTMTTTAGTTQMRISVCPGSALRASLPAPAAAVLLADGSVMEIMTALMGLMSTAVM